MVPSPPITPNDLWMSMAYQRPSLAIHFTWKLEPEAVMALLPHIEAKLASYHARPHWAKVFTLNTATLEPLYPRLKDFRTLTNHYDPTQKFQNQFTKAHLTAAT